MMLSSLTGKYYDERDAIRIVSPPQASFYWHSGVQPYSIYPSKDFKTEEPIIVFVFSKSKTKDLYKQWLETKPNKQVNKTDKDMNYNDE